MAARVVFDEAYCRGGAVGFLHSCDRDGNGRCCPMYRHDSVLAYVDTASATAAHRAGQPAGWGHGSHCVWRSSSTLDRGESKVAAEGQEAPRVQVREHEHEYVERQVCDGRSHVSHGDESVWQ